MSVSDVKKITTLFVCCIFIISCDIISGIDVTNQQSVDNKLRFKLEKHISPECLIYEIRLGSTENFSTQMDVITVIFKDAETNEIKKWNIDIPGNQKPRETQVSEKKLKSLTSGKQLRNIDFSTIASNIEKAFLKLQEDNKTFSGVKLYRIFMDNGSAIHEFCLTSKGKSEKDYTSIPALITYYDEYCFKADSDVTFISASAKTVKSVMKSK